MKKTKGVKLAVIAAVLAVIAIASAMFIYAAKSDDYSNNSTVKKYQQALKDYDKKIKDKKKEIASLNDDIDSLMEAKEICDELIEALEAKILMNEQYKLELESEIARLTDDIAAKEMECSELYEETKERIRIAYEDGDASYISMILGAESLTDFLIGLDYATSILEFDLRMMEELKAKQAELETAKATQVEAMDQLKDLIASSEADKADLELQSEYNATMISSKMADAEKEKEILARLEADKEKDAEKLDKYIEELEKKNGVTQNVAEGQYMWPVPVSVKRISSSYGNRKDPFTGKKSFHSGIDIPSKAGTPIFASNNGTVIIASNDPSASTYGKYIMIDHGGGKYTVYAHCRKLLVKVGDYVKKGTQIAEMGTTGRSTGNHLHFEVREGKNRVNPLNYVTKPK